MVVVNKKDRKRERTRYLTGAFLRTLVAVNPNEMHRLYCKRSVFDSGRRGSTRRLPSFLGIIVILGQTLPLLFRRVRRSLYGVFRRRFGAY